MNLSLPLSFICVTEAAALAAMKWVGRGDKEAADDAAVKAMRQALNQLPIRGEIVIGEGEIDLAPMLYIGEKVGLHRANDDEVSIAVDPIDGTRMTAMGQANALAVLALGDKDAFLHAPDMYMEKLVVGKAAYGVIDLNLPFEQNAKNIAQAMGKSLNELNVAILDKPRHQALIGQLHQLGIRVTAIPDGDVAAAIQCCLSDSPIDVLYGIGGAPEGVVAAAAVRALGGDMQAKLMLRHQVKGDSAEQQAFSQQETARCQSLGVPINQVLTLDALVKCDDVAFIATGITQGDLVKGVCSTESQYFTETLVICGVSKTIRKIQSWHQRFV